MQNDSSACNTTPIIIISDIMLILPAHIKSSETPASVPKWKAATLRGSARQVRQLAGAQRPSWLTAGPPECVRLERRETDSFHLLYTLYCTCTTPAKSQTSHKINCQAHVLAKTIVLKQKNRHIDYIMCLFLIDYLIPCATIASATLKKPATFAPMTRFPGLP